MDRYVEAVTDVKRKAQNKVVKMLFVSIQAPPQVQKSPLTKASASIYAVGSCKCLGIWRPVQESNPCYRREREAIYGNSKELSGMDSTLPHLKDSGERLLDA